MANKTVIQKDGINKTKPSLNPNGKNDMKKIMSEKVAEITRKKPMKKSSALLAASMGHSSVDAVKPHSSKDVRGSSGLANTGTIISYD